MKLLFVKSCIITIIQKNGDRRSGSGPQLQWSKNKTKQKKVGGASFRHTGM